MKHLNAKYLKKYRYKIIYVKQKKKKKVQLMKGINSNNIIKLN